MWRTALACVATATVVAIFMRPRKQNKRTVSVVGTHQRFTVDEDGAVVTTNYPMKLEAITAVLQTLFDERGARNVLEIGTDGGEHAFLAAHIGYAPVTAVDPNVAALGSIQTALIHLRLDYCIYCFPLPFDTFSECRFMKHDVVLAVAVMHLLGDGDGDVDVDVAVRRLVTLATKAIVVETRREMKRTIMAAMVKHCAAVTDAGPTRQDGSCHLLVGSLLELSSCFTGRYPPEESTAVKQM